MSLPEPQDLALGVRMQHARRAVGLTLKQVAQRAQCSESLVSKIENGHAEPSLSMLRRLAQALETTLTWLTDEPYSPDEVHRAQQRSTFHVEHEGVIETREALHSAHTHALLKGEIRRLAPQWISPMHQHKGQVLLYVLKGSCTITVDEQCFALNTHDSFSFCNQRYHYENTAPAITELLWVQSPA